MDAVTDIPVVAAILDHSTAGTNGLVGDFVLCNDIIAVGAIAQVAEQFHIFVQVIDIVQHRVGQIFSGDGVTPDAECKPGIPSFLRAQAKPGGFKRCESHSVSSKGDIQEILLSICENMRSYAWAGRGWRGIQKSNRAFNSLEFP